ncbi:MAG: TrkH family potassium uptake protein [Oscillospiraceae bacterium]
MNKAIVFHYISKIMFMSSALFLLPCAVSLIYGESYSAFVFAVVAFTVMLASLPLSIKKPKNTNMYAREGLAIAALLWIIFPITAALPFYISGEIPRFVDAVFESISGFTTTGSTIMSEVEHMSKGMLFWRCFSHWIGGMGVLVFAIAILPSKSGDSMHLMRAECAGPQVGKIVPKGKNSAMYLYIIYAVLTVILTIFLLFGGMPLFDSICHAMSTAGTGGFSVKNTSIGYYDSAYIDIVITVGMILFGVNFTIYYLVITKRFKNILYNTELKVYLAVILLSSLFISLDINRDIKDFGLSLRYAVFQVSSIMTSTGFGTADFNQWSEFSRMLIIILMFIGACAGSTGGGLKVQRIIIMFRSAIKSIRQTLRPRSVYVLKGEDKTLDIATVHGVQTYLIIYLGLMVVSMLIVSLDNNSFETTFSAVVSCMNNIGPGLDKAGPMENFGFFSDRSKIVLSIDMILGRLECFPLIIILSPTVWRKNF